MFTPKWRTFNVENEEQDHLLFMLDVLYEKLGIFKKQYWLGALGGGGGTGQVWECGL